MKKRLHAIVEGQVQGVSFRYYTQKTAHKLDVTGWVRNNRNGTVEVIAEGDDSTLEQLLDFLNSGSPAANVTNVQVDWGDATGEFDNFRIAYHRG